MTIRLKRHRDEIGIVEPPRIATPKITSAGRLLSRSMKLIDQPAPEASEPSASGREVLASINSKKDPFLTLTTVRLGLGRVPPHSMIEVDIISPCRRTVRGSANAKGDRVYLNKGWKPGDRGEGWPQRVVVGDVRVIGKVIAERRELDCNETTTGQAMSAVTAHCRGPKWLRSFLIGRDGTIHVCHAATSRNEAEVAKRANEAGMEIPKYLGHRYFPTAWLKDEFPESHKNCELAERLIRETTPN
jgi:hypothetical protein